MTEELRIVVRARADAEKTLAEFVHQNGPQMMQTAELTRAFLAANQAQIAEIQSVVQRAVESVQPHIDAMLATIREALHQVREAYTMPVIPRYIFDLPAITMPPSYLAQIGPTMTLLDRLQANRPQPVFGPPSPMAEETEEAKMMTGTAIEDAGFAGMDWLMGELLRENDDLRLRIVQLRAELRLWQLDAYMAWGSLPYPELKADEFGGN